MPKRPIFRQIALDRLSSPEQLDHMMRITNPAGWLALLALAVLISAAIVWSIFGSIPTRISGQGILIAPGGISNVISLSGGQITDIYVDVGEIVQAGQVVARVAEEGKTILTPVASPQGGRVLEIKLKEGDLIGSGASIISLEPFEEDGHIELIAIVYLPPSEGKNVKPGMQVQVAPSTVKHEEYGFLLGHVVSVSAFPATRQGMLRVLGSEELVQTLSLGSAPIEVHVDLVSSDTTPSGYQWTSSQGPPIQLTNGTFVSTWITIRSQRPIGLLFPMFGDAP